MREHIGKTVKGIISYGVKGYNDKPIIKIEFEDGTKLCLMASNGEYSGNSLDEYPCFLEEIEDKETVSARMSEIELYEITNDTN